MKAKKLGIQTRVSNELIADNVSLEEQLGKAIVKALGYFLGHAGGTVPASDLPFGVASPQGITPFTVIRGAVGVAA